MGQLEGEFKSVAERVWQASPSSSQPVFLYSQRLDESCSRFSVIPVNSKRKGSSSPDKVMGRPFEGFLGYMVLNKPHKAQSSLEQLGHSNWVLATFQALSHLIHIGGSIIIPTVKKKLWVRDETSCPKPQDGEGRAGI